MRIITASSFSLVLLIVALALGGKIGRSLDFESQYTVVEVIMALLVGSFITYLYYYRVEKIAEKAVRQKEGGPPH